MHRGERNGTGGAAKCYCQNIHQNLFTSNLLQAGHSVFFQLSLASLGANFEVDQSVFEIPKSYNIQDDGRNIHVQDEDNEIMQFAIQQSLLETGANKVSAGVCAAWARIVQQELKETSVGSVFLTL